jgi:hypothetical protein
MKAVIGFNFDAAFFMSICEPQFPDYPVKNFESTADVPTFATFKSICKFRHLN